MEDDKKSTHSTNRIFGAERWRLGPTRTGSQFSDRCSCCGEVTYLGLDLCDECSEIVVESFAAMLHSHDYSKTFKLIDFEKLAEEGWEMYPHRYWRHDLKNKGG